MLKFFPFGSGSSGNAYMLFDDDDALLIDAGVGIRNFKKHAFNFQIPVHRIHNIICTHDHTDHVKSVQAFAKQFNAPVWTTSGVHQGILSNYTVHDLEPQYRKDIEKNHPYQIGSFVVTAIPVPHDSRDCVGYRIEYKDLVIGLLTDVGHPTEEMRHLIREANYLILEANHDVEMLKNGPYPEYLQQRILSDRGHLSNKQCAELLVNNATPKLRHVFLCHLSEENNHPELALKTVEQELRNVGIAPQKDFLITVLKRTSPTGLFEFE